MHEKLRWTCINGVEDVLNHMSTLAFHPFCCACEGEVIPSQGGLVMSCGDFLCHRCERTSDYHRQCPGCLQTSIRVLNLQNESELPDQVIQNMSDISKVIDSVKNVVQFQIKHYKNCLKRKSIAQTTNGHGFSTLMTTDTGRMGNTM